MNRKICKHGEQLKLEGGGIYFLCRFDWERKNSQCKFVKWCVADKKYYSSLDEGGNMCPHFEKFVPELPKVIEAKTKIYQAKKVDYEEEDIETKEDLSDNDKIIEVFDSLLSD
jgi:hypothetical protein